MTAQELIELIEQSPELQETLRKYVLTKEFLAIPVRIERIEADVADLKASQQRLEADVADLKAGQQRLEAGQQHLEAGQQRLESRMDKLEGRMDRAEGYRYEQKAIKNARSIITQQTGLGRVRISFSQGPHQEDPNLVEQVDQAADNQVITQAQEAALWDTDLIASTLNRTTREMVYIVAEASISLSGNDIFRARSRADILAEATGEQTMAAVICARADNDRLEQARRDNVTVITMPHDA